MKRQVTNSTRIFVLACLLMLVGINAFAYTDWNRDWCKVEWKVKEGVIHHKIRYYQCWGSMGDGHCGFANGENSGGATLTCGTYTIKFNCDGDGKLNKIATAGLSISDVHEKVNDGERYIEFDVPITSAQMNTEVTTTLTGTWWRRGATEDNDVSETWNTSCQWNRSDFQVSSPVATSNYDVANNRPAIKIPWSRTSDGNAYTYGDIKLCNTSKNQWSTEGKTSFGGSTTSGPFYLYVDGSNPLKLNNVNRVIVYQSYTPSKNSSISYNTQSSEIIIPAYPQVDEFEAEANLSQRTIKLTWSIPNAPADYYIADNFVIKYTKKNLEGNTESGYPKYKYVAYKGGVINYSTEIALQEGEDNLYDFEIYRETTKNKSAWSCFTKKINNLAVNTNHARPTDAHVTLSSDQKTATVTWKTSGSVWSDGTRFTITRINNTYSSSDDITLTKADFNSGKYEDKMIRLCNNYTYKLSIAPNDNFEAVTPVYTEEEISPFKLGTIDDFDASKGYFSDKTELTWSTTGSFDNYIIERRIYNTNDVFRQVQSVSASSTSSTYLINDATSLAGTIYEYRVYGLLNCGGNILSSADTLYSIGFRTPTGDFYGRVTFQDGQAVDSVEVRLETTDEISGQSLYFSGSGSTAKVDDTSLLSDNNLPVTLQAWIKPTDVSSTTAQHIIYKRNMYDLGISAGKPYFSVGNAKISAAKALSNTQFTHLSGVYNKDAGKIYLYINDSLATSGNCSTAPTKSTYAVTLGEGYKGNIDEVRIWNRALDSNEISTDYTRYLIGNESKLAAYYTFDYITSKAFYDQSYVGSNYNEHHGTLSGVTLSDVCPSINQLGYKALTDVSGTYAIRAVPYYGNGTAYTLYPRKGTHQFDPASEIRFINSNTQSHTVNFVDNSSFKVSGTVVYQGGTYPVEGAYFTIDGVTAMKANGEWIYTDAKGEFEIDVPVGVHEVRVMKTGHTFLNDGRITQSNGQDRNYQDILTGLLLEDITKVQYVGRICGGPIQEAYPVGFGLSKNNLADNMTITLTPKREAYALDTIGHSVSIDHHVLTSHAGETPKTTTVEYNKGNIVIHVNNETGEFVAPVYPEQYTVTLGVYKHEAIPGDNSDLDLTNAVRAIYETYTYQDSALIDPDNQALGYKVVEYTDSVPYMQKQVFTKRYRAQIEVKQRDFQGNSMPYFGDETMITTNLIGEKDTVMLYDTATGKYLFDKPVFTQNETYFFGYEIFEEFLYYTDAVGHIDPDKIDRVPVEDATVGFGSQHFAYSDTLVADENYWQVTIDQPTMDNATGSVNATFVYGESDNPTSVNWENPMGNTNGEAYILGCHQTGVNFVTAGPDKLLTVLRDPPGSNSYSYLEKGTTFTESNTYRGGLEHEGTEIFTNGVKSETFTITLANTPASSTGTSNVALETESGLSAGVKQSAQYTGSNTKTTVTTVTQRFQTSDDPLYVGANGDVYVGYSTNITFGSTLVSTIVPKATYDTLGADAYVSTYTSNDKYALVQTRGLSMSQSFNTLFAYPQIYLEQTLIPNLEDVRNSLLLLPGTRNEATLQDSANINNRCYYMSTVPAGDENFGQPGYYNAYLAANQIDSVASINQSIAKWYKVMSDNDSIKVKASKQLQNFSFHAGSPVEYSEQYSTTVSSVNSFDITVGAIVSNDFMLSAGGGTTKFSFEEHTGMVQGGEFTDDMEASHAKGFVLAESGDDDYLSVDVLYENNGWKSSDEEYGVSGPGLGSGAANENSVEMKESFPTFVFRTRGGATSCPYEGEYTAVHWKNHESEVIDAATMQLEVPTISVDKNFQENIPSGEAATFTLHLRNNSETGEDQTFDIIPYDRTNPNGAIITIDGNPISGSRLAYHVPAGNDLQKTLSVRKGTVLNYDSLGIILISQCQNDPNSFIPLISDTVYVTAHFTPSCTSVRVGAPSNNWTYNTKCASDTVAGIVRHYMPITLTDFDVNYTDFDHIELQYKATSASDDEWITLAYYYDNDSLVDAMVDKGFNALRIQSENLGNIFYNFYMDELPDQRYDIRAVSFCNINNQLYANESEIVSGIKDMYNPRLFGAAKPANGILTVTDEIRLDFNETIAEGLLTKNNFSVTGIRNGAATTHDVAIQLDGKAAYLSTELSKNYSAKDLTIEGWIKHDYAQNATIFSHGDTRSSLAFSIDNQNYVTVRFGKTTVRSNKPTALEAGSWNHVALTYNSATSLLTAYVNWVAVVEATVDDYDGIGLFQIGRDIASESGYFNGKVDQFRLWNACRSSGQLQVNSAIQLSGNDVGLIGYYAMDEARGTATADKARGVNLVLHNAEWALPEGFATRFDGQSGYFEINSSATVCTADMDYTLGFWFKAAAPQVNAIMLSNGDGVNNTSENPKNLFAVGWNASGELCYRNNGYETVVPGNWADDTWHNFAFTVSRSSGHARIYIDGQLQTYITADMVGGISSDRIFVGACGWHDIPSSTHVVVDRFFNGSIDEIRLWKLYRTQAQMEQLDDEKLDGSELGLLAYYPFEHYITFQGVPELQYTLKDFVTNDTLLVTRHGNTIQSSDIAPVKTKGAVSSLTYDFVVNNDALIITLKEDDYRIENTIVNFTATDVRDVNGNSILSPITWSAYIDRNQLMWQEDEINIQKKQYDEYTFKVGITNKGGFVQNYTIENLPSWLTATPEAGTLNPTKSATIEFSINSGLNVGTYNEVVYLVDAQNVSEPLSINVVVTGEEPTWTVDKNAYEYNSSVFGQMRFEGVFSMDEDDILAAFDGKECIGVAHTSYNAATDMYYVLLTIYSHAAKSTNPIMFRMYDASTGIIYQAEPSQPITFAAQQIVGTPMEPVIFDGGALMFANINLKKGWNWISFNLANEALNDINAALAEGNWSDGETVKNLHSFADYVEAKQMWVSGGRLTSFNNNEMYLFHVNEDKTLAVSGTEIDPTSVSIAIAPNRWNYISYLPQTVLSVKSALAGYEASNGDVIKSQNGFAMYYGNEWIGSLETMRPNEGYMFKSTATTTKTLTYPSKVSTVNRAPQSNEHPYAHNMSIFGYSEDVCATDKLYAVVNGEIRGEAVPVVYDDRTLLCISVAGDNTHDEVHFLRVREDGTSLSSTIVAYAPDNVSGEPAAPLHIVFDAPAATTGMTLYPIPASTQLTLSAIVQPSVSTRIDIYDVMGKMVYTSAAEKTDGFVLRSIDVSSLVEGTYFLRFVHGDEVEVQKFIKF